MTTKKIYNFDNDDFLRGRGVWDDSILTMGAFSLNSSDIVPLKTSNLTESDMQLIVSRLPQYPFAVSKWQSVIGANGRRVVVKFNENNSDSTAKSKKRLQDSTYRLLYTKKKYDKIEASIIELIAREGMAIVRFDNDMMPVVDSRFRYNLYWNEVEKKLRFAYLEPRTNVEMAGLKNLYEGQEIYVIRHPSFAAWPIPLSPAETILLIARLEFHATIANQKIFDNGMIGQVFLQLEKELLPDVRKSIQEDTADKQSWFTTLMKSVNDKFRGSKKANQVSFFPGLAGILEVGKNNKEMQFIELLTDLTPARIAWNWLLTPTDFGVGGAQTQNNVSAFDDSLYDKFGRPIEKQLDTMVNEWLLPALGVNTSESFYVEYIPPEDPKKLEEIKQSLEEWKAGAITLNEFREKKGLIAIENGDRFISDIIQPQVPELPKNNSYIDAQIVQPKRTAGQDFFFKARSYKRASLTNEALNSEDYQTFDKRLKTAFNKQLKTYVDSLDGLEKMPKKVELKPLETFYSFPALKKDLTKFADIALNSVQKDKRTTFSIAKKEFFDGEYPQSVLEFLDAQVERLLKGDKEFKNLDAETASQIETIILENVNLGVDQIVSSILEAIPDLSKFRAEIIAQTEVVEAVEGTREIMYTSDPLFDDGKKKSLTSIDDVCEICIGNENAGLIDILKDFPSGKKRPSFHPRCRCDTLYYTSDEAKAL